MHQIGDEEIRTHVLGGLQRAVGRIGEQAVVLQNGAQRKSAGELVIPLAADNVIVKGRVVRRSVQDAVKDVGVVDFQVSGGLDAHRMVDESFIAGNWKLALGDNN